MADKKLPSPELLRKLLRYEPETGSLYWRERLVSMFANKRAWSTWNARYAGKEALTNEHNRGYRGGAIFNKQYRAHRVIWAIMTGLWPGHEIDHINGIRNDNRWDNLRDVSCSINSRNSKRWANNTSGYNGVSWSAAARKWRAHIKMDGKQTHLGLFDNIADAADCRRKAEAQYGFTERHGK